MATKAETYARLGGLINGLAGSYGGARGFILQEAADTLLSGKAGKRVTDALELALSWSQRPHPQIAAVLLELTGEEPELPEPVEPPVIPEPAPSPVAKKAAAEKK